MGDRDRKCLGRGADGNVKNYKVQALMQLPWRRCISATHGGAHDGVHGACPTVMAGRKARSAGFAPEVPAIHVFLAARLRRRGCPAQGRAWRYERWMPGS